MSQYVLDQTWEGEKERLESIAALTDPATVRYLEALGVKEGWRCAEVGAGAGSIARWLCEHVGASGRVVAVDIDTRFIEMLDYSNLEVRRQNIVSEPLEEGLYDLVHVKILLLHLREREQVLQQLVAALRPGGTLLVEESDIRSIQTCYPPSPLLSKSGAAIASLFERGGVDSAYGLKLLPAVAKTGLKNLGSDCQLSAIQCGSPQSITLSLTLEHLSSKIIQMGLMSQQEVEAALQALRQPSETMIYTPITVSVWGQRA
ncbi:methyltransferase [Dictyobacter sp. S3.2.2.5]|uniref:Methyltransferase n=1 Tax=Dictyobacter halimunensis TaxID=3026934 RepID=A0ABQ6FIF4_9CHLR|nr:methyltransferase [Dictyobacter sp. S3.2.2.5]